MKAHGIDYELTYAPFSRMSKLWTILSLSIKLNLIIHQMDVTTAFLNATLDVELIKLNQHPGYELIIPKLNDICLLKAL